MHLKLRILFICIVGCLGFLCFNAVYQQTSCDYYKREIGVLHKQVAWLWKTLSSCDPSYRKWRNNLENPILPTIFVVTPTHTRPTQKAELTRLSHTLMLVPKLHWILVEDSNQTTSLVQHLLERSGLRVTHLAVVTPEKYKLKSRDPNWLKPRGVFQRNAAISWLRNAIFEDSNENIVYFADDDNTYDLQLFEEMRYTKKVSVWPVGLVGGLKWEGPQISNGHVIGWISAWKSERPFAVDMAGFSVNLKLLLQHPKATFNADVPIGYVESSLLEKIVNINELEPKAENCTKVFVWHTRTEKPKMYSSHQLKELGFKYRENLELEV